MRSPLAGVNFISLALIVLGLFSILSAAFVWLVLPEKTGEMFPVLAFPVLKGLVFVVFGVGLLFRLQGFLILASFALIGSGLVTLAVTTPVLLQLLNGAQINLFIIAWPIVTSAFYISCGLYLRSSKVVSSYRKQPLQP